MGQRLSRGCGSAGAPLLLGAVVLLSLCGLSCRSAQAGTVRSEPTRAPQIQQGVQQPLSGEVRDYLVSEKLDGVRGYWDGQRLLSRSGRVINTPDWFTAGFPAFALDGELWMGRGRFEQISGLARKAVPEDESWRAVRFMVFDLPTHPQVFSERYAIARAELAGLSPYLQVLEQTSLADAAQLQALYQDVIAGGGEGLMLHRKQAHYRAGRSDNLIKLKPFQDAEAVVVAHLPGKGQFSGLLGALLVRTAAGQEFRLGSGFTLTERHNPPPVGSTVTYRYSGYTQNGIPRFARFFRLRPAQ